MKLAVVILAAGLGKRMRSQRPKVLHAVAGRPMLDHVIATARSLAPDAIHVVYGHGGERVRTAFADEDLEWFEQTERLGTGHAVMQAIPAIADDHQVLVLCGDVPLIRHETLTRLCDAAADIVGVLTVALADPTGYGRILRDSAGELAGIVEEKDATASQRAITEINTGVFCLPAGRLRNWLAALSNDNAQGEYYLTDVVALARRDGVAVRAVASADAAEVQGVNNRADLALVERAYQRREAQRLMAEGATLIDPARLDVRGRLRCGKDVTIEPNCVFEGEVTLGDGVYIGPNCLVRDSRLGDGSRLVGHCVIDGADMEGAAQVGPFAHMRPGTRLALGAKVGNFVETKNAVIGVGSKVNHLSYVGDADIGTRVNIGAGTITCNYDGANKHRTVIADEAFIGSGTQLVAPVRVGQGATIGAGTTLRQDAPDGELTVGGSRQKTLPGWRRPTKAQGEH